MKTNWWYVLHTYRRHAQFQELEKPPPDEIDGWRTHAWILVLPPNLGIEEPFFIEPSEGNGYPLNAEQYQYIESVYNNENYYVSLNSFFVFFDIKTLELKWE